jgi:hypothetical protein
VDVLVDANGGGGDTDEVKDGYEDEDEPFSSGVRRFEAFSRV